MKLFRKKSKAAKFKTRQKSPVTRVRMKQPRKAPGYKKFWPKL